MTITSVGPSSVSRRVTRDVRVLVTFTPADPVGATEVALLGDDTPSVWRTYQLIDAAARRLAVYADAYRQAAEADREEAR